MANVTYFPSGTTVTGDIQDSLLETALDNNIEIDHNCGGNCACTTCAVLVEAGDECLSVMRAEERETLEENNRLLPNIRLACQTRILEDGNIVVTQQG